MAGVCGKELGSSPGEGEATGHPGEGELWVTLLILRLESPQVGISYGLPYTISETCTDSSMASVLWKTRLRVLCVCENDGDWGIQ